MKPNWILSPTTKYSFRVHQKRCPKRVGNKFWAPLGVALLTKRKKKEKKKTAEIKLCTFLTPRVRHHYTLWQMGFFMRYNVFFVLQLVKKVGRQLQ